MNKCRMKIEEPIDRTKPISSYYWKIDDIIKLAADVDKAIRKEKILDTNMHAVLSTGQYLDAIKEWKNKNKNGKKWVNFKIHFSEAYHANK